MKILIAAACACVIGMTGWFALNTYAGHKEASRSDFLARCAVILDMWKDGTPDLSGKNESELRLILATLTECQEYYQGKR